MTEKLLNAATAALREFKIAAPRYAQTQDAEIDHGFATASIREFGKWVVPADAEDDGDYDWEEPTKETCQQATAILARVAKLHPGVRLSFRVDEKNWLSIIAKAI